MNHRWTTGKIVAATRHEKTTRSGKSAGSRITEILSNSIPGRINSAGHHTAGGPGGWPPLHGIVPSRGSRRPCGRSRSHARRSRCRALPPVPCSASPLPLPAGMVPGRISKPMSNCTNMPSICSSGPELPSSLTLPEETSCSKLAAPRNIFSISERLTLTRVGPARGMPDDLKGRLSTAG